MQTVRTNLSNNASTQYTNHDFNSMILFNGLLLGAGSMGLRKLCCGTTDSGSAINSYFVVPKNMFGMRGRKRCQQAYVEGECDGALQISLTGDDKTTIGPFSTTFAADEGAQRRRVTFGRGLKWSYGSYKVESVAGASFSIDNITVFLGEIPGGK